MLIVKTEATDDNKNNNGAILISKLNEPPPVFIQKMIMFKKKRKTNTLSWGKPRNKYTTTCSFELWNHIAETHSGDYLCPKSLKIIKSIDQKDCSIESDQYSLPNKRIKIENTGASSSTAAD